ncbi:Uncharacterised protein [Niallia circulans]|jgi:hypothetical protein|uniref:hypothetical protein n=1 Tax=Niallia circulans TaxID=1397 RepID=UPI00077C2CCE|nr:hypothetical protein [Niallia circulans]MDR4318699.1 hypothetical protein [Niallia circulans]MED3839340.1 hypothetical protein [Niallia circulans]MED4245323.1 hypothetical protein [Niallia circulans]MED4250858.1 hypothetical protein [Niallia circulans]QKH60140.1 hypothetical protein FOC77_05470 [Niallia circulans]
MTQNVYVIESIERKAGEIDADLMRIGRRVIPALIQHNASAVLVHENDHTKSIVTSRVEDIEYLEKDSVIIFMTKHTTYKLRKVAV